MERFSGSRRDSVVVAEIRAAIARKGVTPLQVSREIGMNRSGIYRRLNGETPFTLDEVLAVAKYLKVSPGTFFEAVHA